MRKAIFTMPVQVKSQFAPPAAVMALVWVVLCLANYFYWIPDRRLDGESLLWLATVRPIERLWQKDSNETPAPPAAPGAEQAGPAAPVESAWLRWLFGNPMCVGYCWLFALLCMDCRRWLKNGPLVRIDLLNERTWVYRWWAVAILQCILLVVSLFIVIAVYVRADFGRPLDGGVVFGLIPFGVVLNGLLLWFVTSNLPPQAREVEGTKVLPASDISSRHLLRHGQFAFVVDYRPDRPGLAADGTGKVPMIIGQCAAVRPDATAWYVFSAGSCEYSGQLKSQVGLLEIESDYHVLVTEQPEKVDRTKVPVALLANEQQMQVQVDLDTRSAFERKVTEAAEYKKLSEYLNSLFETPEVSYTPEFEEELAKREQRLRVLLDELRTWLRLNEVEPLELPLYGSLYQVQYRILAAGIAREQEERLAEMRRRIKEMKIEVRGEEQRQFDNSVKKLETAARIAEATGIMPKPREMEQLIDASGRRPELNPQPVYARRADDELVPAPPRREVKSVPETPVEAIQRKLRSMRVKYAAEDEHLLEDAEKDRLFEEWVKTNSQTLRVMVEDQILKAFKYYLEDENFQVELTDDAL